MAKDSKSGPASRTLTIVVAHRGGLGAAQSRLESLQRTAKAARVTARWVLAAQGAGAVPMPPLPGKAQLVTISEACSDWELYFAGFQAAPARQALLLGPGAELDAALLNGLLRASKGVELVVADRGISAPLAYAALKGVWAFKLDLGGPVLTEGAALQAFAAQVRPKGLWLGPRYFRWALVSGKRVSQCPGLPPQGRVSALSVLGEEGGPAQAWALPAASLAAGLLLLWLGWGLALPHSATLGLCLSALGLWIIGTTLGKD